MKIPSVFPATKTPAQSVQSPSGALPTNTNSQPLTELQPDPKPEVASAAALLQSKTMSALDIISPPKLEIDFDYIKIGDVYLRTLFVSGYPRFVSPGWLEPIVNFDHSLDISFYIFPVQGKSVLDDLRRKIAEMEAEISTDLERGKVVNPSTQAKLDDARVLQEQLVKGVERFFEFSFYITIPATSVEELNNLTRRVESTLGSLLVVAKHATLDMQRAFLSTSPFGIDRLSITRNMDTTSLATTFPFTTAELSSDRGILYGINSQNESFIIFDRFSLENSNMTVFATSGAGKTIGRNELVLCDEGDGAVVKKIGDVVEKLISKNKVVQLDPESEGVIMPKLKVFTFNSNLKGKWADVQVAARKLSPDCLYTITTKSGRQITTTGDHNFVVLQDGRLQTTKGSDVKVGDFIPLPRQIDTKTSSQSPQLSKEFLTLLGLITSEGFVSKSVVTITNTDSFILETISTCAQKCGFKIGPIIKKTHKANGAKFNGGYRLLPGPKVASQILALGAGGKSNQKRVPPVIFSLENELVATYLKAYFEGDGGVDRNVISATTKSKNLASDLSYLLSRFGIVARISSGKKYAANTKQRKKRVYYKVSISGQNNIDKFIKNIGFITKEKNTKAKTLIRKGNTNVDVIPGLQSMFREIYPILYNSENPAPKLFSEIKLGVFKPSPQILSRVVENIEKRVRQIESLETSSLASLSSLPVISDILEKGQDKKVNAKLWVKLNKSWHTMKHAIPPRLGNSLLAMSVTHDLEYSKDYVSGALYDSFKFTGESLLSFDKSLWESVVNGTHNPSYNKVIKARNFISSKYQEKKNEIGKVKTHLLALKQLATSDLFWDPIAKIKKIKAKHKYVYDLQVENEVFLAGHGGMFVHNSFFVKLECLRSLMLGAEVMIIDPENEYKALCEAVGGEYISFSYSSPQKINPFDLAQVYEPGENQLGLKILSLHSLFKVILGEISASQEALLDSALIAAYRAKGITPDPATQDREPPLMEDLYKALIGKETPEALDLAARLEKFVKGSYVGVFDQQTTIDLKNPFTVFSVRDLQDALRPIAMFIILDYIWTKIRKDIRRRLLVVDEAWHMMRYQDTAQFLWSIVKRARKYYLGLTTITQDVEDFLSQDIGKAIVTNSAMRVLLKQSPAAIDTVSNVFYLSQGERQLLLAAGVGEGILFAGPHHAPIRIVASDEEYQFVTTKPQDAEKTSQTILSQNMPTPAETTVLAAQKTGTIVTNGTVAPTTTTTTRG